MDFLKSAVASAISKGPPFPYSFADKLDLQSTIWTIFNGTKREDGSNCSIFSFDVTANKSRLPLARNAVKKLRTLRHPGVVKVLDTVETESYIYVATERITPLNWHLRRKSLSPETIKWGLYSIANTLKFINDEAASVHGSIRASSIYTGESGEWKLGGFEVLSSLKDDDPLIYTYGGLVPDSGRYASPEVLKSGWDVIKRQPLHAVDSYDFGLLIFEIFNGSFSNSEQITQAKSIPPSMQQAYRRLVNANPKVRLSVSHFLEQGRRSGGFFETPLIRISDGVESLGMMSEDERKEFVSQLEDLSDDFPEQFFSMKVLSELLKSVEYGGGGPAVLNVILKIGENLSEEDYNAKITPVIVRLFANPDRQIRVCLLDSLPLVIDHLTQKVVNDQIFPQMVTGFTDIQPLVREQTVKAVLSVITKLSDRTINGELLKYLAKTSNDEQPGIRTNTTICLGKIARNIGANTRHKVLTAAFTRSLRDPFVHARNAALLALGATCDVFSDEDCATRILPSICPSLIDREKLIRDQATKTLDVYIQRIRKYAATLPETALTLTASDAGASVPRMSTPQNGSSWAGWAVSSFTNKLASASGQISSDANGTSGEKGASRSGRPSSVPPSSDRQVRPNLPSSSSTSTFHAQRAEAQTPSEPSALPDAVEEVADDDFGGWGDMSDMEDQPGKGGEDGAADTFFDALDNASAPEAPLKPKVTQATSAKTNFDDDGEPDFAAWLATRTQQSKNSLPKGLAKPGAVANGKASTTSSKSFAEQSTKKHATGSVSKTKPTAAKRAINSKPREEDWAADDGWGDGWD